MSLVRSPQSPGELPGTETDFAKASSGEDWRLKTADRRLPTLLIAAICLLHLLLPLRHHLYPGDIAWTEEGHRYSWRMMLRTKQGHGYFVVRHPRTGEEERIDPGRELRPRQERKLYTHPDMILQYAHHLRDRYAAAGDSVEVHADIRVRLNDGPSRPIVDTTVNLAAVEWSLFRHSPWIMPYEERDSAEQRFFRNF